MLKILAAAAALLIPTAALAQTPAPNAQPPIQVMVVGAFHFDNPGRDINNIAVDPVTTPSKQAELARIAAALQRFHPTAVALEREALDPSLIDPDYAAFTPADLLERSDERVQLAYRLAHLEGLSRVYAIDEQPRAGEDYFPFGPVQA
jgi:hypothetical protein